jgi:pimeloyl-ACP methyl ester carboxylesterase
VAVRELYPPIEPFDEGSLKVSDIHTVHYEQVGNPKGKKALFLHGGPGGGLDPDYRRYFNPAKWHLTLFDQRGSVSASTSGSSSAAAGAARWPSPTPRRTRSA